MLPPPPSSTLFPYTTLFRSPRINSSTSGFFLCGMMLEPVQNASGSSRKLNSVVDQRDRKSTRLNSSHSQISYAVFCLKKKRSELDGYRRLGRVVVLSWAVKG